MAITPAQLPANPFQYAPLASQLVTSNGGDFSAYPQQLSEQLAGAGDGASAAGGAAGTASRFGGLLAKTPFTTPAADALGGEGLLAAGGKLGPGSIGRGLGYAVGGQVLGGLAQQLIGQKPGASWDEAIPDAIKYGGMGAGVGSLAGPWGTAIGGAGGAAFGALKDLFFTPSVGHQKDSAIKRADKQLTAAMLQSGMPQYVQDRVLGQARMAMATATSPEEVAAVLPQIIASLPQMSAQYNDEYLMKQQQVNAGARYAALQSMFGPMLDRNTQLSNLQAKQVADLQTSAAGKVSDPALRSLLTSNAQRVPLDTANSNAALITQILQAANPSAVGIAPVPPVQQMQSPLSQQLQPAGR